MKLSVRISFESPEPGSASRRTSSRRLLAAFTLLEVMIALGIFFIGIFAILELVTTNIRNARLLQDPPVDAGLLIADLVQTNKLTEGSDSGDFGDLYPGTTWTSETTEISTNGFFQIDYVVTHPGDNKAHAETRMSVQLWRPLSQKR